MRAAPTCRRSNPSLALAPQGNKKTKKQCFKHKYRPQSESNRTSFADANESGHERVIQLHHMPVETVSHFLGFERTDSEEETWDKGGATWR